MSDLSTDIEGLDTIVSEGSMPVEVELLTDDYEITGIVYVSRDVKENRRLTDLLNDSHRRFLAITDARLVSRKGQSTPRYYSFIQIRLDTIDMLHPSAQNEAKKITMSGDQQDKMNSFRDKLS